jgi:hypothetical protein
MTIESINPYEGMTEETMRQVCKHCGYDRGLHSPAPLWRCPYQRPDRGKDGYTNRQFEPEGWER